MHTLKLKASRVFKRNGATTPTEPPTSLPPPRTPLSNAIDASHPSTETSIPTVQNASAINDEFNTFTFDADTEDAVISNIRLNDGGLGSAKSQSTNSASQDKSLKKKRSLRSLFTCDPMDLSKAPPMPDLPFPHSATSTSTRQPQETAAGAGAPTIPKTWTNSSFSSLGFSRKSGSSTSTMKQPPSRGSGEASARATSSGSGPSGISPSSGLSFSGFVSLEVLSGSITANVRPEPLSALAIWQEMKDARAACEGSRAKTSKSSTSSKSPTNSNADGAESTKQDTVVNDQKVMVDLCTVLSCENGPRREPHDKDHKSHECEMHTANSRLSPAASKVSTAPENGDTVRPGFAIETSSASDSGTDAHTHYKNVQSMDETDHVDVDIRTPRTAPPVPVFPLTANNSPQTPSSIYTCDTVNGHTVLVDSVKLPYPLSHEIDMERFDPGQGEYTFVRRSAGSGRAGSQGRGTLWRDSKGYFHWVGDV